MATNKLGLDEVPVMVAEGWTDAQRAAYVIADNKLALNAGWDDEALKIEFGELSDLGFDLSLTGFSKFELDDLLGEDEPSGEGSTGGAGSLAERFGVPPFSVLNAREGWWQDRKRAWLALGIQSELGRGAAPGGGLMPMDRAKNARGEGGLTWGNHPAITEPGLNHYRKKARRARG